MASIDGPPPVKPGWRTSEFWLSLLAVIVGAVASSGILPGGAPTQVAGIASTVLGALGYGANRSAIKRAGVTVLCLLLLAAPVRADEPMKPSLVLPVAAAPAEVPPAAIIAPPLCTPTVKPAPAWASYLGWGLAAATEALALGLSLYQRAP